MFEELIFFFIYYDYGFIWSEELFIYFIFGEWILLFLVFSDIKGNFFFMSEKKDVMV